MYNFYTKFLQPLAFLLYFLGFFIHRRRQSTKAFEPLYVYYGLTTVLHLYIAIEVAFKLIKTSNIWLYDISALLTMLFISFHFFRLLGGKKKKQVVIGLTSLYVAYAIVRQFTFQPPRLFDSIGYSLLSASVAAYVFMYFHQVLKNVTEVSILKDFNFWLSSSYLLYFVGSFIIFVNYHSLTSQIIKSYTSEERALVTALWGMHNVLLFLGALSLLTGSLWISYRRKLA